MIRSQVTLLLALLFSVLARPQYQPPPPFPTPSPGGQVVLTMADTFTPPDCCTGVLTFTGGNQLFVADLEAGTLTSVYDAAYTDDEHWLFLRAAPRPQHPEQLAFFGTLSSNYRDLQSPQIYILDFATRRFTLVPDLGFNLRSRGLSWSPDGRMLLYQERFAGSLFERQAAFFVVEPMANTPPTSVYVDAQGRGDPLYNPLWHPVNGMVTGLHNSSSDDPESQLAVSDVAVSGIDNFCWQQSQCALQTLYDPADAVLLLGLRDWHPSGNQVLAVGQTRTTDSNSYSYDLLELDIERQLVRRVNRRGDEDVVHVVAAHYSPDGRYIAYAIDPDGPRSRYRHPHEIIIVRADDYAVVARLPISVFNSDMAWGPPLPDGVLPTPTPPPAY